MALDPLYQPRAVAPWGDYGAILVHGMTTHAPRRADGRIPLERTGPFVPPITYPGNILVNDDVRGALERSGLSGLSFTPVHKTRIVWSSWETWDRTAEDPEEDPAHGEPEDYILAVPHDEELARSMRDLHAIVPTGRARIEKRPPRPIDLAVPEVIAIPVPGSAWPIRICQPERWTRDWPVLVVTEHDGSDFALAPPYEIPILSERACAALASEWIEFERFAREG
ncbi:hypothetical protein [Sandaracinus amylolyticus]|uniref:Uncharacterized protein n=1 Tax=Sandaracinus amylolyticus TaxID=927083 RepID=A0A0F6W397_9BACT|nr:hypothetical protein [Sandaracinus amylolyticus]AKF06311.1 hypothetical protein DB32_003460 [Sandaracinus amylolyticus]